MQIIDEIISALSSDKGSLTEALLKTKVLLHKIGHKELAYWVSQELNGYGESDVIPEYRHLRAQVLVNASNRHFQVNSHPIPLSHLTDSQRQDLEDIKMQQSLAVLEKLCSSEHGTLQSPIPMEFNGVLGRGLANGFMIQQAWCEIQTSQVVQIFIQVRSRLLEFILQLQEGLTNDPKADGDKSPSPEFDAAKMFNNAIFGDNATIIVGSQNTTSVNITIKSGDFASLSDHLRKNNVSESDINTLSGSIKSDVDSHEHSQQKFGPNVRRWLGEMLTKAAEASWQIELGIASSLLANALQKFYGWQ